MQATEPSILKKVLRTRWFEDHLWIPSRKLSFSFRINRGNSHWFSLLHFQRSTLLSSFLFKMISALKQFTNWLSSCFFLSVSAQQLEAMFTSWRIPNGWRTGTGMENNSLARKLVIKMAAFPQRRVVKKRFRFLLSAFTLDEKTQLSQWIQELGGTYYESPVSNTCWRHWFAIMQQGVSARLWIGSIDRQPEVMRIFSTLTG